MKILLATLALMTLALPGPLSAAWLHLPDTQVQQLHQAVCAVPVRTDRDAGAVICDSPIDYPDPAREGSLADMCPLSFNAASRDGSVGIFYGRFTANEAQAFAVYQAECEPHANNFGGAALFRIDNGNFTLIRYFPGMVAEDCVVPSAAGDDLQTLYCYTSYMGQGELTEQFGPVRFMADGTAYVESWLSAGNSDAAVAVMTECGNPEQDIRLFTGLRVDMDTNQIVVEGAVLDLNSVISACDRFLSNDFNDDETALRSTSELAAGSAFIRPEEERYLKVLARFSPPDSKPVVDITTEPVNLQR